MSPKLFPQQITNELSSKVKDMSPEDVSAIISTIISLNGHRAHDDGTPEDLANFVVETQLIPIFHLAIQRQLRRGCRDSLNWKYYSSQQKL